MKHRHITFTAALYVTLILLSTMGVSGQENRENKLPHFLFPSFGDGVVFMKDDKPFSAMLNYNLLEQRMVTELNGTYRYSKDPALIDSVLIGDRVFIPVEDKFYELISRGMFTFLVQHRATLIEAGHDVGYGVKSQSTGPTQYKRFEMNRYWGDVAYMDLPPESEVQNAPVFWVKRDEVLEKFNNGRQLLKLFPEFKQPLQGFLDREKINFKSPEDVTRLGNYLNTLAGAH